MSSMTYADRVKSARETGIYEPYRARLQHLMNQGYTRWEITTMMPIGRTTVELAIAVLDLHVEMSLDKRDALREMRNEEKYMQSVRMVYTELRLQDTALVNLMRRTYGPIGKGFSTA